MQSIVTPKIQIQQYFLLFLQKAGLTTLSRVTTIASNSNYSGHDYAN
jgi:hypothetical protein